jgi:triacylglycerol lipase
MTVSTRHLVDPELIPSLDETPPFALSAETLAVARQGMVQPAPGTLPEVRRTEHIVPGTDVRVLLYEPPARTAPAAGLVWMHGGGYVMGSAEVDDPTCRRMAAETGAVVASVDYRLAPETTAPGPVEDCYAALSWLSGELGGARLAVGGASAGGGLAACLAILARDRGEIPVGFQLLIYPMLDDRTASTVDPHPYAGEFVWTAADNRFGWTSLLGRAPGGPDVSPYAAAARVESVEGLPATFISVGALDLFTDEDVTYATRLLRAGIPTELHVYPGAYHGFRRVPEARATKVYLRDLVDALGRYVNA